MKYTYFILFLFVLRVAFSQSTPKIDSLKQELKTKRDKTSLLIELAEAYIRVSPNDASDYATKAYQSAAKKADKAQMAEALKFKAQAQTNLYNYQISNQLTDSAIVLYSDLNDELGILDCKLLKTNAIFLQGNYDEALMQYKEYYETAIKLEALPQQMSALINMGRIHWVRGNNQEALHCFKKSDTLARELQNSFMEGTINNFLGMTYQAVNDLELAIEHYLKAIPFLEQNHLLTQLPYVYISLGSAFQTSKNYNEALKYLKQAETYFRSSNDTWGLYELNRNMGQVYISLNKLDTAWNCFQEALTYSREINEKSGESLILNFLGEISILQANYDEALVYLNQSLELNSQLNNNLSLANILLNIGKCQVYMGRVYDGLETLHSSLELADSIDALYEQMVINKEISMAYSRIDDYKKAMRYYVQYATISDSIYQEEAQHNFAEMEKKYESEKQKQQIGQLRLDKVEQEVMIRKQRSVRNIFFLGFIFATVVGFLFYRSYKVRKKADEEKEALLKEIHHRVKNNLQIISSLLSIQTDNLEDTKVINAVQESQSRVKAMALIHQLLYQDKDITKINFKAYLPQLINTLSSIFKKDGTEVTRKIEVEDLSFDIDIAIPLGLIVAELVANAYKYAYNRSNTGELSIKIDTLSKNTYLLTVADNGPGLPESTNIRKLSSMGLRLVNILTNQLDGVFNYSYNKGAEFTVQFSNNI